MSKIKSPAPTSNAPKVWCSFDELVPQDKLKLHPKNPNTHPADQLRLYLKIIQANGWRRPVVVSKRSGFVVKGNGAVLAARAGNLESIPVNFQEYENEAQEIEDMLADNELARLADTDSAALAELLKNLEAQGRDLELSGILASLDTKPKLKELKLQPPPKMAWVLLGIPIVKYSKISTTLEDLAKIPGLVMESTCNDNEPDDENRQP